VRQRLAELTTQVVMTGVLLCLSAGMMMTTIHHLTYFFLPRSVSLGLIPALRQDQCRHFRRLLHLLVLWGANRIVLIVSVSGTSLSSLGQLFLSSSQSDDSFDGFSSGSDTLPRLFAAPPHLVVPGASPSSPFGSVVRKMGLLSRRVIHRIMAAKESIFK
jgi:hypothetical protein